MLPLTPTRLGRYEIVDEIGKGAMGVVYLARDPLIGRLVALKTFRIGYSVKDQEMEQFRIRFMREAQSAGILTHPNIVTIHDVVEQSEEGLAFIAMEYVRGTNLKLMLQGDQPLTMAFVLDTVAQVGEALDYAHSNRVIHRDVKPANILITTENRVKITDFGIARLDSSNLTQEGQLLGTPNYMAPEQIQGKDVDYRTDLFSLGVVLYEMLTRHKPFQGENLTVVSHRIVYDHFTPLREYIQDLPSGIDRICSKALEKDPARRYQRAREMVDDLRKLVESSAARDDLNETQSLSSTLVLPPPVVPPPPKPAKLALISRWRKRLTPPPPLPAADLGTQESVAASPPRGEEPAWAPPLPPAASTEPPPPQPHEVAASPEDTMAAEAPAAPVPKPAGGRPSPRQLAAGLGVAAVLAVLLGAAVLLWRSWSQPAPAAAPAPVPQTTAAAGTKKAQLAKLAADAEAAMRRADFETAAKLYGQAEQIDPIYSRAREVAEWQQENFKGLIAQEKQIADGIRKARQLIVRKQFDQAVTQASAALWLDSTNEDAKQVLAEAQKGQAAARLAKQRAGSAPPGTARPGEQASTPTAPGEAQPGGPEPSAPAEVKEAKVHIRFQSEINGTLMVMVDSKVLVRGNLRPRRSPEFTQTIGLSPGPHELRVYVTPDGKGAIFRSFPETFRPGGLHHLEIYLAKSLDLTAQLN